MTCPKCSGEMAAGFIPDVGHGETVMIPRWHPGDTPEKSFWHGLKVDLKQGIPITAFRCAGCGFVELYAKPA